MNSPRAAHAADIAWSLRGNMCRPWHENRSHSSTPKRFARTGGCPKNVRVLRPSSVLAIQLSRPPQERIVVREVTAALGVSVSRAEFTARRWELERVVRAAAARAVVG